MNQRIVSSASVVIAILIVVAVSATAADQDTKNAPGAKAAAKAQKGAGKAAAKKLADQKAAASKPAVVFPASVEKSTPSNLPIQDPAPLAAKVDKLLTAEIAPSDSNKTLDFSKHSSDEVFLKRAYQDVIGRNPSPDEVTTFVLDPSTDKRKQLVDRLLADPRYGENWGRYWRDVIMYRRADERALLVSPALNEYLVGQFNANRPWDEIARSFITADGDVRENGATGIIFAQQGVTPDITAEVSRIFMGVQIQCAQCHDHKTDRWKRTQFHELAAFFPRIRIKPDNEGDKRTFVVDGNDLPFARLNAKMANRPLGSPEHYMPDLDHPDQKGTRMQPVFFLTGQKLDFGTSDGVRRETIARWMTAPSDEWFAKAFVNRIWAELVGEGFYEPIDDLGPDRTCSAPKTIDTLAKSFVDSKYDVKQLFRTILATEAYQRESRERRSPDSTPFVANCTQRLRGDQLYDALVSALGMRENLLGMFAQGKGGGGAKGLLRTPRNQFNQTFGFDPSTPRDEISGSIPQALLLMNGPQINREINGFRGTDLAKLLNTTSDNEAVTTELYLRCLGREPNDTELKTCLAQVKDSKSRSEAYEDILWALINSTEFLHRK
jgi:hypothetical protein